MSLNSLPPALAARIMERLSNSPMEGHAYNIMAGDVLGNLLTQAYGQQGLALMDAFAAMNPQFSPDQLDNLSSLVGQALLFPMMAQLQEMAQTLAATPGGGFPAMDAFQGAAGMNPHVARQFLEAAQQQSFPAAQGPRLRAGDLARENPPVTRRGGGGLTPSDLGDNTSIAPARDRPATQVRVPFYSQFEGGHGYVPGDTACFKAAKAMANAAGARPGAMSNGIQIATGEDSRGRITVDPQRARQGVNYIDQQLNAGRPVVVGVSHADNNYNADGITDHAVTITGRGRDERGRTYYTFNDPATGNASKGSDRNPANRFYLDESTGKLVKEGRSATGFVADRRFEVSVVLRNQ